jgi:hypothetical protein
MITASVKAARARLVYPATFSQSRLIGAPLTQVRLHATYTLGLSRLI